MHSVVDPIARAVGITSESENIESDYNKRAEQGLEADIVIVYKTKDDPKAEEEEEGPLTR